MGRGDVLCAANQETDLEGFWGGGGGGARAPPGDSPDLGEEGQYRETLCPHPVPLRGAPRVGCGPGSFSLDTMVPCQSRQWLWDEKRMPLPPGSPGQTPGGAGAPTRTGA